jgi:pilus assembly protein CpaF
LPVKAIREQVSRAINLIVHEERLRDGTRRVVAVTEVVGMEGELIVLQDIFSFAQQGMREGKIVGELKPTGVRPRCYEQIQQYGLILPPDLFGKINLTAR